MLETEVIYNFLNFSAEDELSRPEVSFVGAEDELTRPKVWVNLEAFLGVFSPNFFMMDLLSIKI